MKASAETPNAALLEHVRTLESQLRFEQSRANRAELRLAGKDERRRTQGRLTPVSAIVDEVAPGFWDVVREIGAECEASGAICYSIEQWKRFCAAARDPRNKHLPLYGTALVRTVRNVETMIADGKTAEEIRRALYFVRKKHEGEAEAAAARERADSARAEQRAFEAAVQEKLKDERARLEARRRAREEFDQKRETSSGGRRKIVADDQERLLEVG